MELYSLIIFLYFRKELSKLKIKTKQNKTKTNEQTNKQKTHSEKDSYIFGNGTFLPQALKSFIFQ